MMESWEQENRVEIPNPGCRVWDVKGRVELTGDNSGMEWNQPERWEGESAKADSKMKSHMGELPWGVCMHILTV